MFNPINWPVDIQIAVCVIFVFGVVAFIVSNLCFDPKKNKFYPSLFFAIFVMVIATVAFALWMVARSEYEKPPSSNNPIYENVPSNNIAPPAVYEENSPQAFAGGDSLFNYLL